MEAPQRPARPDDELFLRQQRPQSDSENQADSPTVGPLRISKSPPSFPPAKPTPPSMNGQQNPYRYPSPYAQQPTSPPPTGPLPVPHQHGAPSRLYTPISELDGTSRGSTPSADGQRRFSGVSAAHSAHSGSSRTRFSPDDPNRPTAAGYAHSPSQSQHSAPGGPPKPLPDSPGPDTPDKDGLFQRLPEHLQPRASPAQTYYPPPHGTGALVIPNAGGVNRLASTASVSTTKAARGSPPPPETPAGEYPPPNDIAARYAAAGIAGPSTLTNLQAQTLAAQQRQTQHSSYSSGSQEQRTPTAAHPDSSPPLSTSTAQSRRWTPTELPGVNPYGPTTTYQGDAVSVAGSDSQSTHTASHSVAGSTASRRSALEEDMNRLNVSGTDEAPPAYSSVEPPSQSYPVEKRRPTINTGVAPRPAGQPVPMDQQSHPAFANDPLRDGGTQPPLASPTPSHLAHPAPGSVQGSQQAPSPAPSRVSPPPLPEGWIAHLDQGSGQYYYIHLPTNSTQWEFPKGPTPLNLDQPPLSPTGTLIGSSFISPTASTFGGKPGLASPGFPPDRQSMMSLATISSPTAAGFSSLPPAAGVDMYRVAPTNGVYFGPYLRYTNMDVENGIWYGSILLVTDAPHPPTIHIHQSADLSPDPRQLKANHIYQHKQWQFYRYDIDLRMEDDRDAKWTYAITSHLGCTRYEFLVASRYETSWRFIAHSGNDFALNVNNNERTKLGGVGHMWRDILQKHVEVGGFHAQLGMGNQIYADRIWKEVPSLKQWTAMSGKDNRKNATWTLQHDEDVKHAYFHYYSSHFDQPHLREAFAQIPHVLTLDDHDIFDGFGSYPEYMQFSNMFRNIGRIGVDMYLLFQHHTTLEILGHVNNDLDLFTITGTGWHFIKYLGPAVVVVGPDCRSERNQHQVMAGPTYQGLFPKVAVLPPHVQHCIWMIPVPLLYPRLESAEQFAQTMATGKRAVTGAFNTLGKVTGGVAGIVGAKGVVNEGFSSIKKAVGKSGLMSNVLSPFGELDIMDELRDQWTHESKDLERTYLIRTLQGIAHNKALRMTFFSGAVNCCGAGLVHDPSAPGGHKTMYQVISSGVVNSPPSAYVLRMLHPNSQNSANRPIYVPQNGQRSGPTHAMKESDTKEDMLEIFGTDVNGQPREMKRLMGRRNYIAVVAYDPEMVHSNFTGSVSGKEPAHGAPQLSLAIDFFVQGDAQGQYSGGGASSVKRHVEHSAKPPRDEVGLHPGK
ncbi:hypothetical protein FH972_021348 [Carpinus fangiana]|uniref:WW domain-containing protein n=1 Tax=Carpinus fangiana TaxID=176857 RepID=A0A5N6KPB1_9ROSI|nr:hypothetical protein FH972_021348 [Carpinus fangiana]